MRRALATAAVVGSLTLAACGAEESQDAAPAPGSGAREMASSKQSERPDREGGERPRKAERHQAPGIGITLADSQFGEVLFDEDDRAIYLFDKETSSKPRCYGDCAVAWPPVVTDGEPQAGGGVDRKLLGTTKRDDGTTQVTYGGHPLYYYVDDPPGEVLCHNVEEFGGLWLVLDAGGNPVA
jgi:predicted lipoprotein with Yx(FWY)xxD motif